MIDKVTVKIINKSNNDLPQYSTPSAAGMDLRGKPQRGCHIKPAGTETYPHRHIHRTAGRL